MPANDKQVGGDHYKSDLQHWDMIEDHGIGYLEGCATKYVARWRKKDGIKDLQKAHHYVEKLLEKNQVGRWSRGEVPAEVIAEFNSANDLGKLEADITYILTGKWSAHQLETALHNINTLIKTAPKEDPTIALANKVIDAINECDLSTSLTVLSNVVGQVVVACGNNVPSEVNKQVGMFTKAVSIAASNKLLFDATPKGEG